MEIQVFKYEMVNAEQIPSGRDFNYFNERHNNPPLTLGGKNCVDSMQIMDIPDDALTSLDMGWRTRDDIRVFESGRFALKLDRQNAVRSELDKNIDEFFASSEVKGRKFLVKFLYGARVFEGFIDNQSIDWDYTWTSGGDDLSFEVDETMHEFFASMKSVNIGELDHHSEMFYDDYFARWHFVYWWQNGSIPWFEDKLNLQDKLGWRAKPVISGALQAEMYHDGLNLGYSVYQGTLSFAKGLGISLKLESIAPNGYEPYHTLPFKLTMFLETDGFNEVEVENLITHNKGYSWAAKQNFIIPYWHMIRDTPPVLNYYFGLFMAEGGSPVVMSDEWGGNRNAIIEWKEYYDIEIPFEQDNYYAAKDATYLLDVGFHAQSLFKAVINEIPYPIYPAYCRIMVESFVYEHLGGGLYRYYDTGFPEICAVTAQKVYAFMCGQFKEKRRVTVDFDEDTDIHVGSVIVHPEFTGKVERINKLNLRRREAELEVIEI